MTRCYEVRNMIMSNPGASAPVVFGGKLRAVMLYLDRIAMQARGLSPVDVMRSGVRPVTMTAMACILRDAADRARLRARQ